MSFSVGKSLSGAASRLFLISRNSTTPICRTSKVLSKCDVLQNQRGFTRSMWHLCGKPESSPITLARPVGFAKTCGCCGLHTKGDQELVEFLKEEIKYERDGEKTPGKLPRVKDFDATTDGAEVYFTKSSDGESIKITLNVNNSVDDDSMLDFEGSDKDKDPPPPQMVARPPFVVEISKGGEERLAIQCSFPHSESNVEADQESYEDLIQIDEVAMVKGENWDEKVYSVSGTIMDGNLYDLLLNTLEEREIDGKFVDQLVEFCTEYEHKRYIEFLEKLQQFAGAK